MAHVSSFAAAAFGQLVPAVGTGGSFYVAGDNAMKATGAAKTFKQMTDADTIAYKAVSVDDPSKWEIGLGTYNNTTGYLARTTIQASSNSNNAVNFQRSDSSGNGLVRVEGLAQSYVGAAWTITSLNATRAHAGGDTTAAVVSESLATLVNDLILAGVLRGTVA